MNRFTFPLRLGGHRATDIEVVDAEGYRVCLVYGDTKTDAKAQATGLLTKLNMPEPAPMKAPPDEISQPEVIERLARALIEEIDRAGPKDLKHAKMLLDVHAEDYSVRASRRRLYGALAEILGEEAQS